MEILLVEDSTTLRANMASALRAMGHVVHHAESGEKCLHMVESCQNNLVYDLILMDVDLPGLDGFETTRLLREILNNQWIPIIFVTGVTDEASYAKGIEAGGDDYLAKPISGIVLKAKIRAMERIAEMQHKMSRLNKALKTSNERDALTRLLNRRAFHAKAENQWQQHKRKDVTAAVIMLDVDHFKQYNDTYGHQQGDEALRRVSAAIRDVIGSENHLVARYGGEEFVVFILDNFKNLAVTTAECIRDAIYNLAVEHSGSPAKKVTVSAGVSFTHNLTNHTLDSLISTADKQLYRAKKSGRNQVCHVDLDIHKTILISVSNLQDQRYLSDLLANRGNIITAESSAECIEIAKYIIPDIVVIGTDVKGDMGGCTCAELKQYEPTQHIPIVLLRENTSLPLCRHRGGDNCINSICEMKGLSPVVEQLIA